MGVMAALNETLYFGKEKFNDLINPAAEGFLIQMGITLILIPIILLIMIPAVLFMTLTGIGTSGASSGIFFAAAYGGIMVIVMIVTSLAISIIIGGQTEAIDNIRKNRKAPLGEVIKYGWKNKGQLVGTFLFNFVFYFGIMLIPIGFMIFLMMMIDRLPVAFVLFLLLGMFCLMIALSPFQIGIIVLPFIVRKREGTGPIQSVLRAWKLYFTHFKDFYLMGLFFMLFAMLAGLIPGVSILVQLLLYPTVITTELILYDDIHGRQFYRRRYVDYSSGYEQRDPYNR